MFLTGMQTVVSVPDSRWLAAWPNSMTILKNVQHDVQHGAETTSLTLRATFACIKRSNLKCHRILLWSSDIWILRNDAQGLCMLMRLQA